MPKRPSKLDPHRSEIDGWLDAEPAITAVEVLAETEGTLSGSLHGRSIFGATQRMVRAWRTDQAKRVIRCGTAALEAAIATVKPAPAL